VFVDILTRICRALKCDFGDIMEYLPDEDKNGTED
jgi:DNA-binding Xre family transcriptional regulator